MTTPRALTPDPFNLIITGVGGQGNVLASRVVGHMLLEQGFQVTIGETFGASQRGGSVMSHLRIASSGTFSPQIPKGQARAIVALEPTEALRVLKDYGNPEVAVLCNLRPIHSIVVISGDMAYPEEPELRSWIRELSGTAWFLKATEAALDMGSPILGNIMLVGALAGTGLLPLPRQSFERVLARTLPDKVAVNLEAFDRGQALLQEAASDAA